MPRSLKCVTRLSIPRSCKRSWGSADVTAISGAPDAYAFWTVEYLYTYGPATGLAEEFLKYLGTPAAVSDLEAAQYTPCPAKGARRARVLCTRTGS